ncbi:MAG: hypothetical protein CMJ88_02730 [Planctomycetes bacterium]|nr:hypothetical protein [Planctomycetota bacterium]
MTTQTARTRAALAFLATAWFGACESPPAPAPKLEEANRDAPEGGPAGPANETLDPGPAGTVQPLPNGMMCYLLPAPSGGSAQIQLGVFAGSLFVAPSLAELAAYTLLHSTDPTTSVPSLKQRIGELGGSIDVKVGLTTTWFDIRVRPYATAQALRALRESLEHVTRSRSQILRMRDELVARRTAQVLDDPLLAAARSLMQAEKSTAAELNALLDRDASEVTLFHSRLYRPERAALTVRSPASVEKLKALVSEDDTCFGRWSPAAALPGESPVLARAFQSGLYWCESPEPNVETSCAVVMRLPDATVSGAAEWLVMHACLTLDGVGGRLEQLQDEAGLSHLQWRVRFQQTPDVITMIMSTKAKPSEVVQMWQLYQRARRSLVDVPPSASELQIALRRARLNAGLARMSSADRQRLDVNLMMRQMSPSVLEEQLDRFADGTVWDARGAANRFQETPAWIVAVGPGRPPELPGLVVTDALPTGFDPVTQNQPTPENLALADPWLKRARAATGGRENYLALNGFITKAATISAQGLTSEDEITWTNAGDLTRRRTIVGQVISTSVQDGVGFEELDGDRKPLAPRTIELLLHEQRRHPVSLLRSHLRGQRKFRPIAQRKVGDREYFVVEAVGDEFDRLRVHIDTESRLIRVVESWERLADDTLVHIREEWSDYRRAGSLRVPHRRKTIWNDGQREVETTYSGWLAQ